MDEKAVVELISGAAMIIGGLYAFAKLMARIGKVESDFRNEIKNLKEDQNSMNQFLQKLTDKLERFGEKLERIGTVEQSLKEGDRRMATIEQGHREIITELKEMNTTMSTIQINIARAK